MKPLLTAAPFVLAAAACHADTAGLQITELFLPHHQDTTRVAIWYPSTPFEAPTIYADSPVFEGVSAHMEGPVLPGPHPVVLFSHGMGGTDRAQAWLGAALAKKGVVTVLVNHPNTTWGDFDMSEGAAHWTRAQDLSVALTALSESDDFNGQIDMAQVMAAGFSYGGWTALSLGGVQGNKSGFIAACRDHPEMEACTVFIAEGDGVPSIDQEVWNASYADARVRHVVAIDPGLVWGLEPADVAPLVSSSLLIGFVDGSERMLATDFDQSGLASLLDDQQAKRIDPAFHFSAMPQCKPAGEVILAEENDDPVCTDPTGSVRAEIHDRIVTLILNQFGF